MTVIERDDDIQLEEETSVEDAIVESLQELRQSPEAETGEPIVEEVASTDAETPEVEAPPIEDEAEEPPQASSEPEETEEERDLRQARIIAAELRERPELGDALVALKQGRATLIDRQVIEAAQKYMQEQQAPAAPTDTTPDPDEDPWAYMQWVGQKQKETEERLNQVLQWREQETQARSRYESEQNGNLLVTTGEEWQSRHAELSEDQVHRVIQAVSETGLIRRYLKQTGDKKRAISEALEAGLRMEFPDLAKAAATNEALREANRKRRAGATAASPRAVSRTPEEQPKPRNSAERAQLIADLIRETNSAQQ